MSWTKTTQPEYRRDYCRYPSDTSDEEWAVVDGLIPSAKQDGRPSCMRTVVDALLSLAEWVTA
jgi:hypothetical protein